MDQKTIYIIIFIILVILIGAFFILYLKMKRIEKNNVELHRNLVYMNNLIETYIIPNKSKSLQSHNIPESLQPNLQSNNISMQSNNIPMQSNHIPMQQSQKQPVNQVNPMSAIGNMLPMMGTIMNMFGGESVASPEDIEEEAKQMMEATQKRENLEKEIQNELSELENVAHEGRLDEDSDNNNEENDEDLDNNDEEDDDDLESDNGDDLESENDDDLESDNGDDIESDNDDELKNDKDLETDNNDELKK
jgi:hypothetical protein